MKSLYMQSYMDSSVVNISVHDKQALLDELR